MTSVPFCSLVSNPLHDDQQLVRTSHLSAVGRCRIHPATWNSELYPQLLASTVAAGKEVDDKKKRKKLYKESVAVCSQYLSQLKLDVSIVDVEVFLPSDAVLASDGLLASAWLDAGCETIVLDGDHAAALEAAQLPRERLQAHFDWSENWVPQAQAAAEWCSTVSVSVAATDSDENPWTVDSLFSLMALLPDVPVTVHLPTTTMMTSNKDEDATKALALLVGAVSMRCSKKDASHCGRICLQDPTAELTGLAFAAACRTDREDGLYTTVVCTRNGEALGLVYSSPASIVAALESGRGVYYSRSRQGLWRKGDTSGHYQSLHRIDVDCDGDALRFTVTQRGQGHPAFCHLNTLTCWGPPRGLRSLEETLQDRLLHAPEGSYTKRLFEDSTLLRDKLVEEAQELAEAETKQHVAEELADVLYFAMTRAAAAGVSIDDAVSELDRRSRKVTRRPGDRKASRVAAAEAILKKN